MDSKNRHNRIDYIEFGTADSALLAKATSFYSEAFGWKYKSWGDSYSDTADSGVASGINASPDHRPHKPLVVVYSESLEAARENVVKAEGKIVKDIFSFPGGRRFQFADPAGNELAVWSDK